MDGKDAALVKAAPCPKSPPKYPDLCGRRRLQLEVQILNREIGYLEEELQSLEGLQPVSTSCKEVDEFVGSNPDPLVPIDKKVKRSCRIWKWLGTTFCFPLWLLCEPCPRQKRIRCSCCYPQTNCRCSLPSDCCSCSALRDCCCFQCQCQCPHCEWPCGQCGLAECYLCTCLRSFCYRTSCWKTSCCGSSSCFRCPSCRIPRCCPCTCGFSPSCCRQSGCCFCPLQFSCCRMPRCAAWDLTFCMPWRWLCCCFPLQCRCCCHGVSCSMPRPSCPDFSCGCIWSCPKCTEAWPCYRCSSTKASCITGCLC